MKRRHEQLDPSQIPISQTSSNDRRHYFSDEHGEIELGTPYSELSHRPMMIGDPHQKKVSIMMMTSESSSQQSQEQIEEEDDDVLEGEIQTITSCHSNTEREMRVALQPVENETSENYETGTQVLDDGQEGRMTLNELGFQTFLGH